MAWRSLRRSTAKGPRISAAARRSRTSLIAALSTGKGSSTASAASKAAPLPAGLAASVDVTAERAGGLIARSGSGSIPLSSRPRLAVPGVDGAGGTNLAPSSGPDVAARGGNPVRATDPSTGASRCKGAGAASAAKPAADRLAARISASAVARPSRREWDRDRMLDLWRRPVRAITKHVAFDPRGRSM